MKKPHILITAGPTREAIDPVRFISNRSTGLMGYELAAAAKDLGFDVTLISGPVSLKAPRGVKTIFVDTACGMKKEVLIRVKGKSALLMASAVCDYRPESPRAKKIKKGRPFILRLVQNPDILKSVSRFKSVIKVGFALETENLIANAKRKLKSKNLDFIIANKATRAFSPFGGGKKEAVLIDKEGGIAWIKNASKKRIAEVILNKVSSRL